MLFRQCAQRDKTTRNAKRDCILIKGTSNALAEISQFLLILIVHKQSTLLHLYTLALANPIAEPQKDDEMRLKVSAAGRRFVMEHFDERVASRIAIEEYKKCFASSG